MSTLVATPAPHATSSERPGPVVLAVRPGPAGLAAARAACPPGGRAVDSADPGLEAHLRRARTVVVLDPGRIRTLLARRRSSGDPAFAVPAGSADRLALMRRLGPHRDRTRWVTTPAQLAGALAAG